MSRYENSLDAYVEGRLMHVPHSYSFRNNSFAGHIERRDGSRGFIRNASKGTPDRILLLAGKFVGLEFKTVAGKQSADQKLAQEAIEEAGGRYFIIRTSEDVERMLKEVMHT